MEFNWLGFEEGVFAVHCATKEDADDFLNECEKREYRVLESMRKGGRDFYYYGKDMCYIYDDFAGVCYSPKGYYEGMGYEVVKWQKEEQPKTIANVLQNIKEGEIYQAVGDRYIKCENGKITIETDSHSVTFLQNEYFRKMKEVDFATAIEYMKQGGRATCLSNGCDYKIVDGKIKGAILNVDIALTLKQIESKWLIEE